MKDAQIGVIADAKWDPDDEAIHIKIRIDAYDTMAATEKLGANMLLGTLRNNAVPGTSIHWNGDRGADARFTVFDAVETSLVKSPKYLDSTWLTDGESASASSASASSQNDAVYKFGQRVYKLEDVTVPSSSTVDTAGAVTMADTNAQRAPAPAAAGEPMKTEQLPSPNEVVLQKQLQELQQTLKTNTKQLDQFKRVQQTKNKEQAKKLMHAMMTAGDVTDEDAFVKLMQPLHDGLKECPDASEVWKSLGQFAEKTTTTFTDFEAERKTNADLKAENEKLRGTYSQLVGNVGDLATGGKRKAEEDTEGASLLPTKKAEGAEAAPTLSRTIDALFGPLDKADPNSDQWNAAAEKLQVSSCGDIASGTAQIPTVSRLCSEKEAEDAYKRLMREHRVTEGGHTGDLAERNSTDHLKLGANCSARLQQYLPGPM